MKFILNIDSLTQQDALKFSDPPIKHIFLKQKSSHRPNYICLVTHLNIPRILSLCLSRCKVPLPLRNHCWSFPMSELSYAGTRTITTWKSIVNCDTRTNFVNHFLTSISLVLLSFRQTKRIRSTGTPSIDSSLVT